MRLLYFNPWNDLALAANDPHYTPPASACEMERDLSELPRMWAESDDIILLHDGKLSALTSSLLSVETLSPQLSARRSATLDPSRTLNFQLLPWGWSPLTVNRLRAMGVPESVLASESEIEEYRSFASRETAVRLLASLRQRYAELFAEERLVGESCWCRTEEEVYEACKSYGAAMLKMPWSGSGRGVRPVSSKGLSDKDLAWVRRTLARQGGVEVEPLYNKVQDFAMEFWAEGGQVSYEGLSLFETTAGGVYAGNLVASEAKKESRLAQFIDLSLLHEVRLHLVTLLNEADIPCWYTGPLGIDMMIVTPHLSSLLPHQSSIHPLLEINLRMTMGWVALQLQRKLAEEEVGTFKITRSDGHYRAVFEKKGV